MLRWPRCNERELWEAFSREATVLFAEEKSSNQLLKGEE